MRCGVSFTRSKRTSLQRIAERAQSAGDAWLWVTIDADYKTRAVLDDWFARCRHSTRLHERPGRPSQASVQLTCDGLKSYLEAIDYAMLVKVYGSDPGSREALEPRSLHVPKRSPYVAILIQSRSRPAILKGKFERAYDEASLHALDQCVLERRSRTTSRRFRSATSRTTSSRFTARCV